MIVVVEDKMKKEIIMHLYALIRTHTLMSD